MEINVKGKTYRIAWEYLVVPCLILLLIAVLILSNFSSVRSCWISFTDNGTIEETTENTLQSANRQETEITEGEKQQNSSLVENSAEEYQVKESSDKSTRVNINKATLEELIALPYIGEVKAKAIIDYRNTNGPFKSVEELLNVKGIGVKTLEKLRPFVTVLIWLTDFCGNN
ncbi:MAG: ComEA family DNA-binding protein [Clostridiaceae bacterium]|nr:ComEA family DNA-binding protein [Clostridiaceae bacterium]